MHILLGSTRFSRYNDQRYGYGMMAFQDGRTLERGKYKDNVIVKTDLGVSGTRKLFDFRLSKLKSRVEAALLRARQASELASQKAEIATSRFRGNLFYYLVIAIFEVNKCPFLSRGRVQ